MTSSMILTILSSFKVREKLAAAPDGQAHSDLQRPLICRTIASMIYLYE